MLNELEEDFAKRRDRTNSRFINSTNIQNSQMQQQTQKVFGKRSDSLSQVPRKYGSALSKNRLSTIPPEYENFVTPFSDSKNNMGSTNLLHEIALRSKSRQNISTFKNSVQPDSEYISIQSKDNTNRTRKHAGEILKNTTKKSQVAISNEMLLPVQETKSEWPNKLLVFALEAPMSTYNQENLLKSKSFSNTNNIVQLLSTSQEYKLIEEMFKRGNCELNSVKKIYNKETYARFNSKIIQSTQSGQDVSLLFFANTLETFENITKYPDGFKLVYEKSPQDLVFSTDLSIAYHFFKRARSALQSKMPKELVAMRSDGLEQRKWKAIISGIILDKVWNERKSYALFALNFEARVQAAKSKGYNVIYFAKDGFYLALTPEICIPIYLLDFTFM